MNQVVKKEFGLDTLDRSRVDQVAVSRIAGGVSFATALEVMEFAKLMSLDDTGPDFLFKNPGTCIRVCFQAIEWGMSPFGVADKAYKVGKKLAYESQLIHAVVEARAPLQKRLRATYAGEGPTRTCTVIGHFIGEAEPHVYTSPEFQSIKVKNSPLWLQDPDQQLFYYASRAWARKWAPDVLLGIYTREELAANPELAARDDEPRGMHARLAGSTKTGEGHSPDHAARELAHLTTGTVEILPADGADRREKVEVETRPEPEPAKRSSRKKTTKDPVESEGTEVEKKPAEVESKAAEPAQAEPPKEPTDAASYEVYARAWIDRASDKDEADARWDGEREMQQRLKVPLKVCTALRERLTKQVG